MRWIALLLLTVLVCLLPTAGEAESLRKILKLRSGSIVLDPVGPPVRPVPSLPSIPNSGAQWVQPPPTISAEPPGGKLELPQDSGDGQPISPGKRIDSERLIVSFERRITSSERSALERAGVHIEDYLGATAYTARVTDQSVNRLIDASSPINPIQHIAPLDEKLAHIKIDPALAGLAQLQGRAGLSPDSQASMLPIIVQAWPEVDLQSLQTKLTAFGEVKQLFSNTNKIELVVSNLEAVRAISLLPEVKYMTLSVAIKSQNTHVRRSVGADRAEKSPHNLTGVGVNVGIFDAGHVASQHPSFESRVEFDLDIDGFNSTKTHRHATHVAGIIAGSGRYVMPTSASEGESRSTPRSESTLPAFGKAKTITESNDSLGAVTEVQSDVYPGVAYGARLLSFEYNQAADKLISLLRKNPNAVDVVNNSWNMELTQLSCFQMSTYNLLGAAEFDAVISGFINNEAIRRIPIVVSAGNNRNDGVCDLSLAPGYPNFRTVAPPAGAKNVITVGAIDADSDEMTEFSGWGPTQNGRLKPDIVAPGCRAVSGGGTGIISMVPASGIGRSCGTSMAAPVVSGAIALLAEKFMKLGVRKQDVLPSTYKALLIHGADDLGESGPDFRFGYGKLNVLSSLKLIEDQAFRQLKIDNESDSQSQEVAVGSNVAALKVTLVWDDPPVGTLSSEELSNNLDLSLISPNGEVLGPSVLNPLPGKENDPARVSIDQLNVVEQVVVKNPTLGAWRIVVQATRMGALNSGQTYSLVMSSSP